MDLEFRDTEGRTGHYCRVKRVTDGLWWDESGGAWVETASAACDISLAEGTVGVYSGTSSFDAREGSPYRVHVYNSADEEIASTLILYRPPQDNALAIVNEVQKQLRMPQSANFNDQHSALMLSFVNKAIDLMRENGSWPELVAKGSVVLSSGVQLITICPVNACGIEAFKDLRISGSTSALPILSDRKFREHSAAGGTGSPLRCRIAGRTGEVLMLEVHPTPDKDYTLDYEGKLRAKKLRVSTDVPLLDSDLIVQGAVALARAERGDGDQEFSLFSSRIGSEQTSEGEPNWGDILP